MRNSTVSVYPRTGRLAFGGFTLIEVLVVVAIIALLVSILLPSLSAARNQAKLTTCKANLKQIATSIATYQAEFSGYVPVMLNDASSFVSGNPYPARTCWVSVALRSYAPQTRKLGTRVINGVTYNFDPNTVWSTATRDAYEAHIMPEYYACPFQANKGAATHQVWTEGPYRMYRKEGRFDSIQTWLSENVVSGALPSHGVPWQPVTGNSNDGIPKFTAISWNRLNSHGTFKDGTPIPPLGNPQDWGSPGLATACRQWTSGDARRLRTTLSMATAAYCAQGEHILGDQGTLIGWANRGSHKTTAGGGTNAIFADTHVEWVPGKQIGWP